MHVHTDSHDKEASQHSAFRSCCNYVIVVIPAKLSEEVRLFRYNEVLNTIFNRLIDNINSSITRRAVIFDCLLAIHTRRANNSGSVVSLSPGAKMDGCGDADRLAEEAEGEVGT